MGHVRAGDVDIWTEQIGEGPDVLGVRMPWMSDPVLLVVDEDPDAQRAVERELRDRYGRHYRIECLGAADEARQLLEDLAVAEEDVALVLAGQRLHVVLGSELLDDARRLHPHARRALLVAW